MKDEDVEIVKMDASNNDVPSPFEVRGFPTLYWVPKNSKSKPVKYEVRMSYITSLNLIYDLPVPEYLINAVLFFFQGGREVDDFVSYVAKHATDELKAFDRKGKAKKEEL